MRQQLLAVQEVAVKVAVLFTYHKSEDLSGLLIVSKYIDTMQLLYYSKDEYLSAVSNWSKYAESMKLLYC